MKLKDRPPPISEEHFDVTKFYEIIIKMGKHILEQKEKEKTSDAKSDEGSVPKR
jgi:hypothetical protein